MSNTTIKITQLPSIGNNLTASTILPVVSLTGTATTDKVAVSNIANFTLLNAGNTLPPAYLSNLTYSVVNAAQPNITSLGNLSGLTITNLNNFYLPGGTNGQLLSTDGSGNLSWVTGSGGGGTPGGSNSQVQFNNNGNFAGNSSFTFDSTNSILTTTNFVSVNANITGALTTPSLAVTGTSNTRNIVANGNVTANFFIGSGSQLSSLTGANVTGTVANANFATTSTNANFATTSANANYASYAGNVTVSAQANITSLGNLTGLQSNGQVFINNNTNSTSNTTGALRVVGGIGANGNIHSGGEIHSRGNVIVGGNTLFVGPTADASGLTNPAMVIFHAGDQYIQAALKNSLSNGSADWVAYGDNGTESQGWADMGFCSSTFNDANYTITGAGDGYLFVESFAGSYGGNLVLATGNLGTVKDIIFATSGFLSNNEFGRISHANNSLELKRVGASITFPDGSEQTTAYTGGGGGNTGEILFSNSDIYSSNTNNGLNLNDNGNVVMYSNADTAVNIVTNLTNANGGFSRTFSFDNGNFYMPVNGKIFVEDGEIVSAWDEDFTITVQDEEDDGWSFYTQVTDGYGNMLARTQLDRDQFQITTDNQGAGYTWQFDNQGRLNLPGNIQGVYGGNTSFVSYDNGSGGLVEMKTISYIGDTPLSKVTVAQNNVHISTSNSAYTWSFDYTGLLTLPDGAIIDTTGNNFEVRAIENVNFEANAVVNIYTDGSGNAYQWQFGDSGDLTVPGDVQFADGSIITDNLEATGDFGISTAANVGFMIDTNEAAHTWLFGDDGNTVLPGNSTLNVPSGTGGAAGYNLSIKAGDADQGDFYTTKGGDINIVGGLGASNDGGGGGPGGNINIIAGTSADPAGHSGNIIISSGNLDWTFDYTGNLTLPANTFSVNYANGTQVSLGGGGNTGNVTFDDVTIQGNESSLNLSSGPLFTANLQYLQVRAGDVATHIHLDTGNNQAYDQYFGNDNKYVKLELGTAGNVSIGTYQDGGIGQLEWVFDSNGNLILAHGNGLIQSFANSSLDPNTANASTMIFTPDQSYSSQALVLDPTAPGHIHLRAPATVVDEPFANIFLGGEITAFEVTSGANNQARIHSGGNTWAFGTDGVLTLPGNTAVIEGSANLVTIYSDSGSSLDYLLVSSNNVTEVVNQGNVQITSNNNGTSRTWEFDSNGTLTAPGDITVSGDITGTAGANTLVLKAQPTTDTYIQLNSIVDSTISIVANLEIVTDSSNTSKSWTFDTNGDLTVPNYIKFAGNSFIGDETSGNIFRIAAPLGYGVILETDADISGNNYQFDFGSDGNLTAPGDIIVTGNVSANNFSGNTNGYTIGYLDIPQVSASNTTIGLSDAGKHYYSTTAGNITLTVPNNATTSFATGTAISIVVQAAGNILVNAASGVTLYMAGSSTAGNRAVGAYGMATLMKVASDTWFISGSGVY